MPLQVCTLHAKLYQEDGDYYVMDLGSKNGTWLNGDKVKRQERQRVTPGDEVMFGKKGVSDLTYKVKQVHNSVWDQLMELDPPKQKNKREPVAVWVFSVAHTC